MFENEWFPPANAMGITWDEFWGMNPRIIKCIAKGHKEKIKEQDALMHTWFGTYGISALTVAVEHCLHGKNAKTEYIDKPIMSDLDKEKKSTELTEEEKLKQTEQVFLTLRIMGINNKLSKGNSGS